MAHKALLTAIKEAAAESLPSYSLVYEADQGLNVRLDYETMPVLFLREINKITNREDIEETTLVFKFIDKIDMHDSALSRMDAVIPLKADANMFMRMLQSRFSEGGIFEADRNYEITIIYETQDVSEISVNTSIKIRWRVC